MCDNIYSANTIMATDTDNNQPGTQALRSTRELNSTQQPRPALNALAIFLDLDGTLAPIASTPDRASIPQTTLRLLGSLWRASKGSVAIVSGRDAPDIDRLLAPLHLPYAALHGARIKTPDGRTETLDVPSNDLAGICAVVENGMRRLPGTIIERKALSIALHYRNAPEFESEVNQIAANALAGHDAAFEIQRGKMVVEIKPRGASKAAAIRRLMSVAPFLGRIPLFAGDDLTDESAFQAVNAMNGISIKVGPGETQASWRLDDPLALSAWLSSLLAGQAGVGDSCSTGKGAEQ